MRVIESVGFLSLSWHTILWCFDFILWHDVASYLYVCWDSAFTFTSVIKLPKDLKLKGVHLVVSTYWTSPGGDTLWALSGCLVSRQGSGVKELKILVRQGVKWDSMIPCCFFPLILYVESSHSVVAPITFTLIASSMAMNRMCHGRDGNTSRIVRWWLWNRHHLQDLQSDLLVACDNILWDETSAGKNYPGLRFVDHSTCAYTITSGWITMMTIIVLINTV